MWQLPAHYQTFGLQSLYISQHVAIVGVNGVGKTLFLKRLMHDMHGICSMAYAPQVPNFHPYLYFDDALALLDVVAHAHDYCRRLEICIPQKPVHQLSAGNVQLMNVVLALLQNADLILLDEAYNHLDWQNRQKVQALCRIRQTQACLMSVTHDVERLSSGAYSHVLHMLHAEKAVMYTIDAFDMAECMPSLQF